MRSELRELFTDHPHLVAVALISRHRCADRGPRGGHALRLRTATRCHLLLAAEDARLREEPAEFGLDAGRAVDELHESLPLLFLEHEFGLIAKVALLLWSRHGKQGTSAVVSTAAREDPDDDHGAGIEVEL